MVCLKQNQLIQNKTIPPKTKFQNNMSVYHVGQLNLIIGPMFSGKTTELIDRLSRSCTHPQHLSVLAINHHLDQRYGNNALYSHDKLSFPAVMTDQLATLLDHPSYQSARVIGIDEAQFFPDLVPTVLKMVEKHHKIVHVAGLLGDADRQPMGQVLQLMPYATTIDVRYALCAVCADGFTRASFTRRIKPNLDPVAIGHEDDYQSVCRMHYLL